MRVRKVPLTGDELYEEELTGGLFAAYLFKPGWAKLYGTLAVRYGSLDLAWREHGVETTVPAGIAHFLEHKLFDQEGGSVIDRFAALGASANAYTNYDVTTYLFSATARPREALELLLAFVQHPHFTPESVAKEQGIIVQELLMYHDDPDFRVWRNLLEALYRRHPVRVEIGGTPESVREITAELLDRCHRTFYHPANMAFFAAGALPPEEVFAVVRAGVATPERPFAVERIAPEEPGEVSRHAVEDRMPVGVPLIQLGFKIPEGELTLRQELAVSLLLEALFGKASPLYARIYEAGLIGERFAAHLFSGRGYAAVVVGGESGDPDRLVAALLEGIEEAARQGLPASALAAARRGEIGGFVSLFDVPEALAHAYHQLAARGHDLLDYLPTLLAVGEDEVTAALRYLAPEGLAVSRVLASS